MPLKKIGKYEVISELGKGAMGVVYKAQDPFLGRSVAIKTMSEMLHDNKDLVQRFYREAQSAGRLRHPNIVTIYDLGEEGGMPFIAMELIEGQDLDDIISSRLPYPLIKKLNIVSQICKGLDYAHEGGIIHRDIKPANIRILPDGKSVKIMDFGIARMSDSNMTRPGMVMGTVSYMSPEQITTPQLIDRRSDLFSVGVILYEFLTYRLPFSGDSIHAILTNIVHQPCTPLKSLLPSCPPGLEALLNRALAKNREERFINCMEMAREIETLVEMLKPQAIQELLQTGQYELDQNNLEAAKRHYEDVISIQSTHDLARTFLRQIEDRQKRPLHSTRMPLESSSATILPSSLPTPPPESSPRRQTPPPSPIPPPTPALSQPSPAVSSSGPAFCPSCGSRIPPGNRFCSQCGFSISPASVSREPLPPARPPQAVVPGPIPEIVPPARTPGISKPASRAPLYVLLLLVLAGIAAGGYYLFLRNGPIPSLSTEVTQKTETPPTSLPSTPTVPADIDRTEAPASPTSTLVLTASNENNADRTADRPPGTIKAPPHTVPPRSTSRPTEISQDRNTTASGASSPKETSTMEAVQNTETSIAGSNALNSGRTILIPPANTPAVIESPIETDSRPTATSAPAPEPTIPERPTAPTGPPPYTGPREGVIEWNGEVQKGDVIVLEGSAASSGTVRGRLPGVPCLVDFSGEKVAITESPGISNQWKRIGLRFDKKGKARVIIHWQVLSHVR